MIIMKKIKKLLVLLFWIVTILPWQFTLWYVGTKRANNPMETLDTVLDASNEWRFWVQETALDGVSDREGSYAAKYKISNTLEYFRRNIDPYLQRALYIGLALATAALIYMWFLLVTNWVTGAWDLSKLKSRIIFVLVWVLLLTWFYAIIKIVVAVINMIFS